MNKSPEIKADEIKASELDTGAQIDSSAVSDDEIERRISELNRVIEKYNAQIEAREKELPQVETIVTSSFKKKMLLMLSVMIASMVMLVSATLAYFTTSLTSSGNIIKTGKANFEVVDLLYDKNDPTAPPSEGVVHVEGVFPGDTSIKTMQAANRGKVELYVRAKIDVDITLHELYADRSDEIDESLVILHIDEENWLTRDTFDGYYYYKSILYRGETTSELFEKVSFSKDMGNIYKDATVVVKVTFEIVQANGNGENVFEATGWSEGGGVQ